MSLTDEPMAVSTRMAIGAALSAASSYAHGLMGAILAEREFEHIASWAGSVSLWCAMFAAGLGIMAAVIHNAELEFAKSQLYAENMDRWERSKQSQMAADTSTQIEAAAAAVPCVGAGMQLKAL